MTRWLDGLQPWAALLLRLVLGGAMVYHGFGKVVPAHALHGNLLVPLQHYSHFIASLGIPAWLGYVSALTEFVGGAFLVLGLLTRFAALLVAGNMAVALCAVNLHHGYAASEYTLALISIAVTLVTMGAGALSVDGRLGLS